MGKKVSSQSKAVRQRERERKKSQSCYWAINLIKDFGNVKYKKMKSKNRIKNMTVVDFSPLLTKAIALRDPNAKPRNSRS